MNLTTWEAVLALPVSPTRDHIRGSLNAPVTLVEYGDYECPHCGAAYPVVEAILEHMRNGLAFAFRHFPLTTAHPHAERAAEAAEAAGGQKKFWAMHGMLFTHQDQLEDPHLLAYAEALGLDLPRFGRDFVQGVYAPKVREDFMSGVRSGVKWHADVLYQRRAP
jgi:protein-disulfide isomerase